LPGQNSVWADYNNDGRLDTSLTKNNGDDTFWYDDTFRYEIYGNSDNRDGGANFNLDTVLDPLTPGLFISSWADYNNDGRPDLLLNTHQHPNDYVKYHPIATTLYRNTGAIAQDRFKDSEARLDTGEPLFSTDEIAGANSSGAWADFDNDGKLDILIKVRESQQTQLEGGREKAKLYRNLGDGVFEDTGVPLPGLGLESPNATVYDMAWGDYNNDGKLDILLTGAIEGADGSLELFTKVYRNTTSTNGSTSFEDIGAQIPGLTQAKAAWGDYDNDGKLDILVTGGEEAAYAGVGREPEDFASSGTEKGVTKVYRNTGNGFTDSGAQIDRGPLVGDGEFYFERYFSKPAWGDYDKDGKLDILLTGYSTRMPGQPGENDFFTKVFNNNTPIANTPPAPPTGLTAEPDGRNVTFKWNKATDAQTPSDGLSYNLRVKTSDGKDILSPMSLEDGTRQIVGLGNVSQNTQWQLKDLSPRTYYWSVQAIDNAWAGSPFATEGSFTVGNRPPEEKINLGGRYTALNVDVPNVYTDPDGDLLTYTLTRDDGVA
jgi:hypothetical protein